MSVIPPDSTIWDNFDWGTTSSTSSNVPDRNFYKSFISEVLPELKELKAEMELDKVQRSLKEQLAKEVGIPDYQLRGSIEPEEKEKVEESPVESELFFDPKDLDI